MHTATANSSEALASMFGDGLPAGGVLRIDLFDEWCNPEAERSFSWVCYNRTCHNKPDAVSVTS